MSKRNRGKEQRDDSLFGTKIIQQKFKEAVQDLSYLLEKGYPIKSSSQLVGNKFRFTARQLNALKGMSASSTFLKIRNDKEITTKFLEGKSIQIDGFNLLIVLESLLSGAYVFKGLDNCYRDLSSVYGSYKSVQQTQEVLKIIGKACLDLQLKNVLWVLDKPVSNSGRLKVLLYEIAKENQFPWQVILENNPDKYLVENKATIVSSDAWILNNCESWFNMVEYILTYYLTEEKVLIINSE